LTRCFNPLHCGAVVASLFTRKGEIECFRHCFNPLHCGAVVASRSPSGGSLSGCHVSIPFIAGQWSLRSDWGIHHANGFRFNPLHCGAVVASGYLGREKEKILLFQSPSLRGSGRFGETRSTGC